MSIFGIPQSFIAYNLKYSAVWSYPFKAAAYYEYWHLLSYRQAFSFVLPIVLVFAIKHKKKMDSQPQRQLHFHENNEDSRENNENSRVNDEGITSVHLWDSIELQNMDDTLEIDGEEEISDSRVFLLRQIWIVKYHVKKLLISSLLFLLSNLINNQRMS